MRSRGLAVIGLAVFLLASLPWVFEALEIPIFYLAFGSLVLFWAAQATSWNILSGYSGYFSFGQGAFFGVGVYTAAVLVGRHGFDFFASIPLGGALAAVLGLAVGGVAFRLRSLRGEGFGLLTLAVPFLLGAIALINSAIDGGQGIVLRIPAYPEFLGGV